MTNMPISKEERQRRLGLLKKWDEFDKTDIIWCRKEFCQETGTDYGDLEKCVDWRRLGERKKRAAADGDCHIVRIADPEPEPPARAEAEDAPAIMIRAGRLEVGISAGAPRELVSFVLGALGGAV